MRKSLILVALLAFTVGGAVFAARSHDGAPPSDPPKPPVASAAKPGAVPQPKDDSKPGDKPVAYTTKPRMRIAEDVEVGNPSKVAWSNDGRFFALQGTISEFNKSYPGVRVLAPHNDLLLNIRASSVNRAGDLVGFTPDSRELVTQKREYDLVSGFHWLKYQALPADIDKMVEDVYRKPLPAARTVNLDLPETHDYAFAPDGKTYRTVAWHREDTVGVKKLEVLEVDAKSGKAGKSILKIDFGRAALAPNGKRLAVFDGEFMKVTVYDLDRGEKQFEYSLGNEKLADLPRVAPEGVVRGGSRSRWPSLQSSPALAFSPDARRLIVSRAIGQSVVLNAETGEAMPALEGSKEARFVPDASAFTGDGRLLAMRGISCKLVKLNSLPVQPAGPKGKGGKAGEFAWERGAECLTVWDTQTGKALKTWNQSPSVAFHPSRPVLAVIEPKGDAQIRLGFWDFAAEAEEK